MLTEEQREKSKWLSTYINLTRSFRCKVEEKNKWKDIMTNISPTYSSQPGVTGVKDNIPEGVATITDIDKSMGADLKKIKKSMEEIEEAINQVEDSTLRNILEMKYVNGKRWEVIAVECNYYIRHVYRLHEEALNLITIPKHGSE